MTHRAIAVAAAVFGFAALVACSSASTECTPGDPSCPGRVAEASDSGVVVANDAASAADACVVVLDSGATRGCTSGGHGAGDHDDGGGLDAVAAPDVAADASNLPFMAPCDRNDQCASGICYDFVVKGYFCTTTCSTNADCPPPSPGCSGMGYCRAPG